MSFTCNEHLVNAFVSGVAFGMPKGVFTLTETETGTGTETDKKWVVWDCVEVLILTETDTVTDVIRFQTHSIGLGFGLCRCERTITFIDVITYKFALFCSAWTNNRKITTCLYCVILNFCIVFGGLTSLICRKSLTPNVTAHPWTGESSSSDPSYATFVRTANATGFDWNVKNDSSSVADLHHYFVDASI